MTLHERVHAKAIADLKATARRSSCKAGQVDAAMPISRRSSHSTRLLQQSTRDHCWSCQSNRSIEARTRCIEATSERPPPLR